MKLISFFIVALLSLCSCDAKEKDYNRMSDEELEREVEKEVKEAFQQLGEEM